MARPQVLIINPNTSAEITETLRVLAETEIGAQATIQAVTARFGARYISSRASVSIAGHAVLDAYASALSAGARPDAVVIACFGDPGLDALREISTAPVFGFADSGLTAAAAEDGDFAIATIGEAWHPMLAELVQLRGLGGRVKGIIALGEDSRPPHIAGPEIANAARKLGVNRVIVGGTGLIPALAEIAKGVPFPIIDPHRRTLHYAAKAAAAFNAAPATDITGSGPIFVGLSQPLNDLLELGSAHRDQAQAFNRSA